MLLLPVRSPQELVVIGDPARAHSNSWGSPRADLYSATLAIKLALGLVLVRIAIRHIRARNLPRPPKKPPKWQEHVDAMSPWFAMGLAPALQPWVLIGAGAATVVEAKLSSWASFLALFLYCVLASASYLAMETYAVVRPDQSQALLARFRTWIDDHTEQIVGLWLVANSIYLIVTGTGG